MAAPSSTAVFQGGDLILSPADNEQPEYGGTQLGTIQSVALRGPLYVTDELEADEYGGEVIDELHRFEVWVAQVTLANWDVAMIQQAFPTVSLGAESDPVVTAPGLNPGTKWSTKAKDILLAPVDYRSSGWRLYHCLVRPAASGLIQFSQYEAPLLTLSLRGLRNSSDQIARISRILDSGLPAP